MKGFVNYFVVIIIIGAIISISLIFIGTNQAEQKEKISLIEYQNCSITNYETYCINNDIIYYGDLSSCNVKGASKLPNQIWISKNVTFESSEFWNIFWHEKCHNDSNATASETQCTLEGIVKQFLNQNITKCG